MNDNDIFLTVNDMREPDKLCAVVDEYIGMGMVMNKIQISDFLYGVTRTPYAMLDK